MRVCSRCKLEKADELYSWKNKAKGKRCDHCKACHTIYLSKHYQDNKPYYIAKARKSKVKLFFELKQKIREYLIAHPCVECGEGDPVVLEFDHVRGEKRHSISNMVTSRASSWTAVQSEIAKCEVRCANCRRIRTAYQFDWAVTRFRLQV